jgi:hypothetical protein
MEAQPILKKTLVTVAVMVGAWVAFVGVVSLVAVLVTSHLVGAPRDESGSGATETSEPSKRLPGSDPGSAPNPNRDHRQTPARTTTASHAHDTI